MALKTDPENVVVRCLMKEDLDQAQEIMNRALGMCMTHFDIQSSFMQNNIW